MGGLRTFLDTLPLFSTVAWAAGEAFHRPFDRFGGDDTESRASGRLPLSPYDPPEISNPALTAYDVPDYGAANFVADPFLLPRHGIWHLFFEVYNQNRTASGAIGYASSSDGGKTWTDVQVVLTENHHLSFPFVFEHAGEVYMIPECVVPSQNDVVRLYRADEFPTEWVLVKDLLRPRHNADDTVVFEFADRWWMVCGDKEIDGLYIYYSDSLTGEWIPHRDNPVVDGRPTASTPAGRPIVFEDAFLLFYQDSLQRYGHRVRTYRVTELTPDTFVEAECPESPVLEGDGRFGWRGIMHHLDAHHVDGEWVCAVDGNIGFGYRLFGQRHWSIGIFKS